jgi:hypothetical protein
MSAMLVTSLPSSDFGNDSFVSQTSKPSFIAKQSCAPMNTIPIPSGPRASIPRKPMRPLTAYHIFFQIEREYLIQTHPEADNIKLASNKKLLDNVPQRYKAIKLSPDWYFGPGKRPKRKHRKAHGKIGFMELSRIIASRWAELDAFDPEVKAFVQKLARQELDEYMVDMKKYKEATKGMQLPAPVSGTSTRSTSTPKVQEKKSTPSKKRPVSPVEIQPIAPSSMSMHGNFHQSIDLTNEIDYFISRINHDARHLVPTSRNNEHPIRPQNESPFAHHPRPERRNSLLTFLEPLFDTNELEQDAVIHQEEEQPCTKKQRRNSPSTVAVDIHDDEIIRMWKENNQL